MCHVPTPLPMPQKKAQLIYLPITVREEELDIARARILEGKIQGEKQ